MKILHLEDDHTKAATVKMVCTETNADNDITLVRCFKFFQHAIVDDQSWDLIISDLNVPMFTGHGRPKDYGREVVGEARRRGYDGPIIFISGLPTSGADYLDSKCQMFNFMHVEQWRRAIEEVRTALAASVTPVAPAPLMIDGLIVTNHDIGACVLYVPGHALNGEGGGFKREECQVGHITSLNYTYVFVNYHPGTGQPGTATDPADLRWWSEPSNIEPIEDEN